MHEAKDIYMIVVWIIQRKVYLHDRRVYRIIDIAYNQRYMHDHCVH